AAAPAVAGVSGVAELAGLAENASGFARAVMKLRDTYAPNVLLAYHLSLWGTNVDPLLQKPTDAEIDALATRSARFFSSLGAAFDLSFAEFSDRDAALTRAQSGGDPW